MAVRSSRFATQVLVHGLWTKVEPMNGAATAVLIEAVCVPSRQNVLTNPKDVLTDPTQLP